MNHETEKGREIIESKYVKEW